MEQWVLLPKLSKEQWLKAHHLEMLLGLQWTLVEMLLMLLWEVLLVCPQVVKVVWPQVVKVVCPQVNLIWILRPQWVT
jgi:hypothetical protein